MCLFGAGLIGSTWSYDILKGIGFEIDFYCDNKKKENVIIRDGIKTISLNSLYDLKRDVLVFVTTASKYFHDIKAQLESKGILNIVSVDYLFMQTFVESLLEIDDPQIKRQFRCVLDDKEYLSRQFEYRMGYRLDLDNPCTFNEKLQWLKLYDRRPEYTEMVDKYEVKKYISDKIGEGYVIPTLGIYDSFDEIEFEGLPNQFVLKCTHDSGSIMICLDKSQFQIEAAKEFFYSRLNNNFYWVCREWPYKNVKPRIIAEKYISDSTKKAPHDYKVFCFEGVPHLIEFICNRFTNPTQDFYDVNWHKTEIYEKDIPCSDFVAERPANLGKMLELSERLASGTHCLRVDWYDVDGQLYLGELTFYDGAGFEEFLPKSRGLYLGSLIKLPMKCEKR